MHIITSESQIFEFDEKSPVFPIKSTDELGKDTYGWGFSAMCVSLQEALDFAKSFISSKPYFLRGDEEWMIEYIDILKSKYFNESHGYRSVSTNNIYEILFSIKDDKWKYLAIQATRLFYLIDVLDAIFYGGSIGTFEVNKKKPKYSSEATLLPLMSDDEEVLGFGRRVATSLAKASHRRYLSEACYSNYAVAIKDDSLDSLDILKRNKESGLYAGELCNFYKSKNFTQDGRFFKNLIISKQHQATLSARFSFYPIVFVQFNARDYANNLLGYRIQLPFSCLVAGSPSYSMPSDYNDSNLEVYFDKEDATRAISHKFKLDSEDQRSLMIRVGFS